MWRRADGTMGATVSTHFLLQKYTQLSIHSLSTKVLCWRASGAGRAVRAEDNFPLSGPIPAFHPSIVFSPYIMVS